MVGQTKHAGNRECRANNIQERSLMTHWQSLGIACRNVNATAGGDAGHKTITGIGAEPIHLQRPVRLLMLKLLKGQWSDEGAFTRRLRWHSSAVVSRNRESMIFPGRGIYRSCVRCRRRLLGRGLI